MLSDFSITFKIPLMCILAIISAVNKNVTIKSKQNVKYCNGGIFSKVFGVLQLTDARLIRAQNRIILRTHLYNKNINI